MSIPLAALFGYSSPEPPDWPFDSVLRFLLYLSSCGAVTGVPEWPLELHPIVLENRRVAQCVFSVCFVEKSQSIKDIRLSMRTGSTRGAVVEPPVAVENRRVTEIE